MKQVPNSISEPQGTGKDCDVIAPMQSHRGMKGCLRDGWRIFALQARKFSLQLLPVSLLVGIAALVFFASCYHAVLKCIVPVYTLSQGAENADMLENAFRLSTGMKMQIVVSGIVLLLAIMVGRGFVWHQIRHFYQHAALPSQRFLLPGKSVMRQIVRYLAYDVIRVIVLAALAAVAVLLWTKWTWASLTVLSLTIQPMAVLPFVVLFFLVLTAMAFVDVMLFPGCYKYLVEDASYKESLLFSLRHGTRRWGGYFVLALLTAIPILSVSVGILTAFLPYALGGVFNMQGMLLGDPSGMPDYATYATGALVVIGVSLCFLLTSLHTWTLAFKVASNCGNAAKNSKSSEPEAK